MDKGFHITEGLFAGAECEELLQAFGGLASLRSRAGARHLMGQPVVAAVAWDDRLLELARQVVGSEAVPYRATLFEKSGDSNWLVVWHQDTALPLASRFDAEGWGPWSQKANVHYAHAPTWALERIVALGLHLDDSIEENGPLRVISGSHKLGVLSDEEVLEVAHQGPSEACLVRQGGVIAMRPLLIHSSQKARSPLPRRVLHIEYSAGLSLAPGITLAVA